MAYQVALLPRAKRELDRLPQEAFRRIDQVLQALRDTPRPFGVKKLDEDLYRIREGDWRILFTINDREHRVVILRVIRRSEKTYRRLSIPN